MKNYKMITAEDGITWITIQPLMIQTMAHYEEAKKIDVSKMSDDEKRGIDFTILSMEAVINFLRSLLAEHELETVVAEDKEKVANDE